MPADPRRPLPGADPRIEARIETWLGQLRLPDPAPWTRRFGPSAGTGGPDLVVVVPPCGTLARGWELARTHDAEGRTVHLLARGVSTETPPYTPRGALVLTELDTCLPDDKSPLWGEVNDAARAWLLARFEGALDGLPVDQALWSSAMHRVLRPRIEAWPLALGLAKRHGHDHIVLSAPWEGLPALEDALGARPERLEAERPSRLAERLFGARLLASCALYEAAAIGRRTLEFHRQAPARARLKALRAQHGGTPAVWITVTGQWPHSCRNVIESVGRQAREAGLPLGVLLQYALEPGALEGGRARTADADAMFPALAHPDVAPGLVAVDQFASSESWGELGRVAASAVGATARLAWRFARRGPGSRHGALRLDLTGDRGDLVRLLTIDLLRAREAHEAARRLVQRRSFAGAKVAFSHASLAPVCIPDLVLAQAGAETFDVVHGGLAEAMDMVTNARTFSGTKLFWSRAEVDYTAPFLGPQRCVGGVPCRSIALRPGDPAPAHATLRVLVLSNYGLPGSYHDLNLPRLGYQRALFEALGHVASARPLSLRWRTHPGDDPSGVAATVARYAGLGITVSEGATLAGDLDGADVVLTSVSSTIIEAVGHPLPVFVHAAPVHEQAPILDLFDASRRFHDGPSLAAALEAHLTLRSVDPGASLAPERALRQRFFGPSGTPRSVLAAMGLEAPGGRRSEDAGKLAIPPPVVFDSSRHH